MSYLTKQKTKIGQAQVTEALLRMKKLKLHENAIREFKESGKLNKSENLCLNGNKGARIPILYWLDEEIQKRLNEEKETWVFKKSFNLKVKDFMEHPQTVAQDYELAIAEGFRSVDAKTIIVEFDFKGKTGVVKIDVDKILKNLVDNEYFSDFDFVTRKSGKELFKSLGASDSIYDKEKHLKCEHISKITYGKKELYVKK